MFITKFHENLPLKYFINYQNFQFVVVTIKFNKIILRKNLLFSIFKSMYVIKLKFANIAKSNYTNKIFYLS